MQTPEPIVLIGDEALAKLRAWMATPYAPDDQDSATMRSVLARLVDAEARAATLQRERDEAHQRGRAEGLEYGQEIASGMLAMRTEQQESGVDPRWIEGHAASVETIRDLIALRLEADRALVPQEEGRPDADR